MADNDIRKLQLTLRVLGYETGPVDGQGGAQTGEATGAFMARHPHVAKGDVPVKAMKILMATLEANPSFIASATPQRQREIAEALNNTGYVAGNNASAEQIYTTLKLMLRTELQHRAPGQEAPQTAHAGHPHSHDESPRPAVHHGGRPEPERAPLPSAPPAAAPARPTAAHQPVVALDCGHGRYNKDGTVVHDKGASGTLNGKTYCEDELNKEQAAELKKQLEAAGFIVLMTGEEGKAHEDRFNSRYSVAEEAWNRFQRGEAGRPVYLSVHHNASEDKTASGTRYYVADSQANGNSQSSKLALALAQTDEDAPDKAYALNGRNGPVAGVPPGMGAVVVEAAFLTNPNDLLRAISKEVRVPQKGAAGQSVIKGQTETAQDIVAGLTRYYQSLGDEPPLVSPSPKPAQTVTAQTPPAGRTTEDAFARMMMEYAKMELTKALKSAPATTPPPGAQAGLPRPATQQTRGG